MKARAAAALFVAGGALTLASAGFRSAAREPKGAEYAVRWNPADGGPSTPAEALALLGAGASAGAECVVRYFDLAAPAGAPAGTTAILRQRVCGGDDDLRLKFRSLHPLGSGWRCPPDADYRKRAQVDIGFGESAPARVYSYSCTLPVAEPPASLHATPKPCASRMTRFDADTPACPGCKVEEWRLPDGGVRLEISQTAPNAVDALAAFTSVVGRLRARGARPVDESKTELGSRCP
ncbi:MAG TPA: hypothetical protein VMN82_02850 [Thermoanaerobaculia bacterium]|nr:hypothetical protein [Thermoanaerobaculia bacterium]